MTAAGLAILILVPIVSGQLRANFADMEAKLDRLEIPEGYEPRYAQRSGGRIAFFGDRPEAKRGWVSPDDLETTCAALEAQLAHRSPTVIRRDHLCHLHLGMRPALWAMAQLNFSYDVTVTALRPKEGPPILVHARLAD